MAIELGRVKENSCGRKRVLGLAAAATLVVIVVLGATKTFCWRAHHASSLSPGLWENECVQSEVLYPDDRFRNASRFRTDEYREFSAALLSNAVKYPTMSFDDMSADPRDDERFQVFSDFHAYLKMSFPLTSTYVELVNSYGLLYTIKGKTSKLPTVLMAHQDVVPVDPKTVHKWTHEPFSGHYDGERVWGRGSADTKSSLIAILEAIESLIQQGWVPEHDVVLSFGFDEEVGGKRGASHLSDVIRDRYGSENSVYMIVDEGGSVVDLYGSTFAMPAVAEKGYTDVIVTVHTPGGHSSVPPDHTGIGIASELIVKMEKEQVSHRSGELTPYDAVAETYTCYAAHGRDLSSSDREKFTSPELLLDFLLESRQTRGLVSTTQAIDVISGGVKLNALPEQVSFAANHRISVHENVDIVTKKVQKLAETICARHKLGLVRDGVVIMEPTEFGHIELANGQRLEPAPVSPHTISSGPWRLISGTTRHVLEEVFDIDRVIMSPAIMGGNTDTAHYWGLTDSIFRYRPGLPNASANAHTVDEWTSIDTHLAALAWYYELLQHI